MKEQWEFGFGRVMAMEKAFARRAANDIRFGPVRAAKAAEKAERALARADRLSRDADISDPPVKLVYEGPREATRAERVALLRSGDQVDAHVRAWQEHWATWKPALLLVVDAN